MQDNKKYKPKVMQKVDDFPLIVELTSDDKHAFFDILLEAIDETLLSFGETAKTSIYLYIENSRGIRKTQIPIRINDFENALEKLFGVGTRYLEMLVMKNLHEKIKMKYKVDIPRLTCPDLTFEEYIRLMKLTFEELNEETARRS